MPYVTIIVLVVIFTAAISYYFYLEAQRKKTVQAERKSLMTRIEKMKSSFKSELQQLTTIGVLSNQGQQEIYRLANYYFVFQPVTTQNVEHCEQLLDSLLSAIKDKMIKSNSLPTDFLQKLLNNFISALPKKANDYNANFYRNDLPMLTYNLSRTEENPNQENSKQHLGTDKLTEEFVS